jgi:hypothetical protein
MRNACIPIIETRFTTLLNGSIVGGPTLGQSCTVLRCLRDVNFHRSYGLGVPWLRTSDGSARQGAPKFLRPVYQDAAGKNTKKYMVIQVLNQPSCGRCQEFKISSVEQGKGIVRQGQQPSLGQQRGQTIDFGHHGD